MKRCTVYCIGKRGGVFEQDCNYYARMRFCMVCGGNISTSEHELNKIEQHTDGRFLITVLVCKKCRDFHEKYLNELTALGCDTDKSSQPEKEISICEISYFLSTTKGKRVIAFYGKGDKTSSDYEISYIPAKMDGYWKFILKKEKNADISNKEKTSEY
jgi:hypothetical protein